MQNDGILTSAVIISMLKFLYVTLSSQATKSTDQDENVKLK